MTISRRQLLQGGFSTAVLAHLPHASIAQLGPAPGIIKLNSNENPYGPSKAALAAAAKASEMGAYYSWSIQSELRKAIATANGIATSEVTLSTGSNEVLCAAFMAWGRQGEVLAPALTFPPPLGYARNNGVIVKTAPIAKDMSIDLNALADAISDKTRLVYLCNPNNPTGMVLEGDEVRSFCKAVGPRVVVLVDEAYNELTDNPAKSSMIDLVRNNENVVVTRTFSKIYGLAGMRIGYAMAPDRLSQVLKPSVMSWQNSVGTAAALASLKDHEFVAFSREKITQGRLIVRQALRQHGFDPLPSKTNFVYTDIGRDANEFARAMRNHGVHIASAYSGYPTYSRVSMGRLEDLEVFAEVLNKVMKA